MPDIPGYVAYEIPDDVAGRAKADSLKNPEEIAEECGGNDISKVIVRQGNTYHEILSIATDLKTDPIVMASHKPDFTDYLIGSTTAHVVRHANCCVFVVRG